MQPPGTFDTYITRRLLDTLDLADQAPDLGSREIHLQAARYYRDLLAPPGSRKAERARVRLPAQILKGGAYEGEVVDITSHGFLLLAKVKLTPGVNFGIKFKGIDQVRAKVVWTNAQRLGCEFLPPIHPAILEAAIAASDRPIQR